MENVGQAVNLLTLAFAEDADDNELVDDLAPDDIIWRINGAGARSARERIEIPHPTAPE